MVLNAKLQVCAIAANPNLSKVSTVARRLESALSESEPASEYSASIVVAMISNPDDFIAQIRSAQAILRFTVEFTLPNPIDTEDLFHKPMQKYLEQANGKKGTTTISGPDLSPKVVEDMTRSVAANGNNAKARYKLLPKQPPIVRSITDNPATFSASVPDTKQPTLKRLSAMLKQAYESIRTKNGQ